MIISGSTFSSSTGTDDFQTTVGHSQRGNPVSELNEMLNYKISDEYIEIKPMSSNIVKEKKYRVAWRSLHTKLTGHGNWTDKSSTEYAVEHANQKYEGLFHWIEEKNEVVAKKNILFGVTNKKVNVARSQNESLEDIYWD
jgi:hypothetical protein